jgi:hypothetical protein
VGFDKVNELESRLKIAEAKHRELKQEIESLNKIHQEQTKALSEIGSHKLYPQKIKELILELKDYKDKSKVLDEKHKFLEEQRKRHY